MFQVGFRFQRVGLRASGFRVQGCWGQSLVLFLAKKVLFTISGLMTCEFIGRPGYIP